MNFFTNYPDRVAQWEQRNWEPIAALREENFTSWKTYPEAPENLPQAVELYRDVLTLAGDLACNLVAPTARDTDEEGVRLQDGRVVLPPSLCAALDGLKEAGLSSLTVSRQYGGANLPGAVNVMIIEMLSQADASLMTLFALQEIAWTIEKYGNEAQKQELLPAFVRGELSGAMTFTEAEAGSDLPSLVSRAHSNGSDWRLNGTKRFITNGDADVHLILARSDGPETGLRGLSLFLYRRDSSMTIRSLETKLGLSGSPTTEIVYENSPCELVGDPRMGLVRYAMALMSNARIAVAAQALGIAQAAYDKASAYARERHQFGKPIQDFAQVSQMLNLSRLDLVITRSFLYEVAFLNDEMELLELQSERGQTAALAVSDRLKLLKKRVGLYVPLLKYYAAEMAQRVCYDAIQVLGGAGYTRDFDLERHYRDVRVCSIYEGTSQIQILGAVRGVLKATLEEQWDEWMAQGESEASHLTGERQSVLAGRKNWDELKANVQSLGSWGVESYSKILVDASLVLHFAHQLLHDAIHDGSKVGLLQQHLRERLVLLEAWKRTVMMGPQRAEPAESAMDVKAAM